MLKNSAVIAALFLHVLLIICFSKFYICLIYDTKIICYHIKEYMALILIIGKCGEIGGYII